MGYLTAKDIENTERIRRLNMINAFSGIKQAALIGSADQSGKTNLAIFNSIIHIGSNPALLGFILRPNENVRRHTYENIMETGFYTINHVHKSFTRSAHYTSAKFEKEISEFDECHLSEEYISGFQAPFVMESKLKLGMKYLETIEIRINNTMMVIGQVELLVFPDDVMNEDGHMDLSSVQNVGVSGLNTYYELIKLASYPYARPSEV